MSDSLAPISVGLMGTGEYTTGITPSGQSKSDKKVGQPDLGTAHSRSVLSASPCLTSGAGARSPSESRRSEPVWDPADPTASSWLVPTAARYAWHRWNPADPSSPRSASTSKRTLATSTADSTCLSVASPRATSATPRLVSAPHHPAYLAHARRQGRPPSPPQGLRRDHLHPGLDPLPHRFRGAQPWPPRPRHQAGHPNAPGPPGSRRPRRGEGPRVLCRAVSGRETGGADNTATSDSTRPTTMPAHVPKSSATSTFTPLVSWPRADAAYDRHVPAQVPARDLQVVGRYRQRHLVLPQLAPHRRECSRASLTDARSTAGWSRADTALLESPRPPPLALPRRWAATQRPRTPSPCSSTGRT
jgi:hypothetical protein